MGELKQMETLTLQEGAQLELLGAERRLQRAKEEYEYFLAVHPHVDGEECQRGRY